MENCGLVAEPGENNDSVSIFRARGPEEGVCLETKSILCSYSTGNSVGNLHFIWKVPGSGDITEEDMVAGNAKAVRVIEPDLPIFHTRAMRRQFFDDFSLFRSARPAVMKEMYRQLTVNDVHGVSAILCCACMHACTFLSFLCYSGDFSSHSNLDESITQEGISLIIDTQDPDIVDDLRHHNKGRPSMYDRFWEECNIFLDEEAETAVDERRHGSATHMAKALSTRDLFSNVAQRCPDGPLPSEQWLRLQFWTENATMKSVMQFTGRFQVKFMVQPRQLRMWHEDSYYCAGI